MSEKTEVKQNLVLVPFLFGGIIGATLGLLLAPRTGKEMRRQIKDLASGTKDKVSSTIGKGIDMYDDARIAVTSAVEAGRQAFVQEREKFQTVH